MLAEGQALEREWREDASVEIVQTQDSFIRCGCWREGRDIWVFKVFGGPENGEDGGGRALNQL